MRSLSGNLASDEGSSYPSLAYRVLNHKYWSGRQNAYSAFSKAPLDHQRTPHHARFMRPTCLGLPTHLGVGDDNDERTDMVFFMPFLHWETDVARLHTHYIIDDIDTQLADPSIPNLTDEEIGRLPCDVEEKLLRKYLHHSSPLHIRRTLDQAYYSTLSNTLFRDRDQVVSRSTRNEYYTTMASPPVLMVDQCWLWVIGGMSPVAIREKYLTISLDTVVTCFPNSWAEDVIPNSIGDPLDLLEKIVHDLNERTAAYEKIDTSQKLATIIIDHCASNVYDLGMESNKQSDKFHFLELFYRSIREMVSTF